MEWVECAQPGGVPMQVADVVREQWGRWLWLCPFLGVVAAAVLLVFWGLTLWTAITMALLLVCPVVVIWALLYAGRDGVRDRLLDEYRRRQKS
jgi:hypothetical protein